MDISLSNLLNLFAGWMVSLSSLFDLLNIPLSDFLRDNASSIFSDIIAWLTDVIGIGQFTFLELIFSVGLGFYLVYQFITWGLNLLP